MSIKKLVEGNKHFLEDKFKKYEHRYIDLVENGQHPKALFIGCSDSRVVPNLITDTKPGDLFVARNIGNIVPPYKEDGTSGNSIAAAVEYAVFILGVSEIIVCGHSHCGAIAGLYQTEKLETQGLHHVKNWLKHGQEAKNYVEAHIGANETEQNKLIMTEKISVIFQLKNLLTYPTIREKVEEGSLNLRGWYYIMESGEIEYYNEEKKEFVKMIKDQE